MGPKGVYRMKGTLTAATAALVAMGTGQAVAGSAATAKAQRTLPSLLSKQIRSINRAPHAPPVLLPRTMPLDARHLWPSGGADGSAYELSIGAIRHCSGANACFVAEFTAAKAGNVFGKRVHVRGASKAGFIPLSCGASCSPPQIDFLVGGMRYTIQANIKSRHGDRAAMIDAAESAIDAGPR
jgi:hypothetical protein